jgi:hypothetical protein
MPVRYLKTNTRVIRIFNPKLAEAIGNLHDPTWSLYPERFRNPRSGQKSFFRNTRSAKYEGHSIQRSNTPEEIRIPWKLPKKFWKNAPV